MYINLHCLNLIQKIKKPFKLYINKYNYGLWIKYLKKTLKAYWFWQPSKELYRL